LEATAADDQWDDRVVPEPTEALPALHRATADLIRGLDAEGWTDADVAKPSLCSGWTRGHVLTHLARNAEGIARTLEGALRGKIVERYPGGWDARNDAIDAGAPRPLAEQIADVQATAYRLDRVLTELEDVDGWDRPTDDEHVAGDWPWLRFREVEIHRVDLAGTYTAADWSATLIAGQLPQALDTVPDRIEQPVRIEVDAADSIVPTFAGLSVTAGSGDPITVRGPDWAVLAWLLGRPAAAQQRLTALPDLQAWR
jgi:maleylpyruvate isomerase